MSFNEWRHKETNYDNRLRGARSPEQIKAIQEEFALRAMQIAVQRQDKALAQSVMSWAQSKRIVN